tara:strand:- start:4501 stop:5190 length:690 start_codon:yes stop_codon:yes gene_type:complete
MIFFLDFDGVIVDSIDECFQVSFKTYYENKIFQYDEEEYKNLFYKNRGLVKPPYEYYILHKSIENFLASNQKKSVDLIFMESLNQISEKEKEDFENAFFDNRKFLMEQDFESWASMNPLTQFGKKLVKKDNTNIYIVTTKNLEATSALLKHHEIYVEEIYSNKDVKDAETKGNLINHLMIEKKIDNAIFIDDACEHLDSINNSKVQCFFADWGYGKNENRHRIYNIDNF